MSLEKKYRELSLPAWLEAKTLHPKDIPLWRQARRQEGQSVVTLNGSFDLMHSGHLYILFEAAKQGDLFVVALNSDASIQKYKSPDRPIITLKDRLAMVASLAFVDYVSYFDETTPNAWLQLIHPDVHVNGAEYGSECVEAPLLRELNARLHLVDRLPGLATSQIIERIKKL